MSPFDNQVLMHSSRTRRRRWMMPLTMLVLLAAVLAAAMQVLPRDGMGALSSRHARKMLADAKRWEQESLYISAAEIYERVAQNSSAAQALRVEAARHLATLYSTHLNDPQRASAALEKAYYLTPEGPERAALREQLALHRGRPVVRSPGSAASAVASSEFEVARIEGKPMVKIGDETITVEEVLYAWTIYHGTTPAEGEAFENFVHWYLDIVLLADEARQRGLQQTPAVALDLHFRRLMALNQAEREMLIRDLADPSSDTLQQYYETTRDQWVLPAHVKVGQIVVKDKALATELAGELKEGASFAELAREHSLDAKTLPKGYEIGLVYAGMQQIPHVGNVPGLAERLTASRDGATTGPIRSERGYHLLRVLEKTAAEPSPLEAIRDDVMMSYQRQALARRQQALLSKLRAARPIEFLGGPSAAIDAPASPAVDDPLSTDTTDTTDTTPVNAPPTS